MRMFAAELTREEGSRIVCGGGDPALGRRCFECLAGSGCGLGFQSGKKI